MTRAYGSPTWERFFATRHLLPCKDGRRGMYSTPCASANHVRSVKWYLTATWMLGSAVITTLIGTKCLRRHHCRLSRYLLLRNPSRHVYDVVLSPGFWPTLPRCLLPVFSQGTGVRTNGSNDRSMDNPTFYLESMPLPLSSGSFLADTGRQFTDSSWQRSSLTSDIETLRSGSPRALQASNNK